MLDIKRCYQKFGVIYLSISEIVDFVDNFFNLFVWNVDVRLLDSLLQLLSVDQTSFVFINVNEFSTQFFDRICIGHFHQHVHGCLFKLAYALEVS
jgi:hypothetical protein